MSKPLLTWSNGVAHGEGGRVYVVSFDGNKKQWKVPLPNPFNGSVTTSWADTQEGAQLNAEAWEIGQQGSDRVMGKATKGY